AEAGTIAGEPVTGIFKEQFVEVEETEGRHPTLFVATNAIPSGTDHGTAVNVKSKDYTIVGMQPTESEVFTLLILEEVSLMPIGEL
ncbi:MAG: hypothetical protein KJ927_14715, partial [Candidatus Eisenbacteria bacterium]|nr:hypothetical protein [Candidatus Eisenbacteria bacterium]